MYCGAEEHWWVGHQGGEKKVWERILVQTFRTQICIHCTPAAIDIITQGAHAARRAGGPGTGEVTEPQALTRRDSGSRSAKHPPDFNGSRCFPVRALDQRSLPANHNTWVTDMRDFPSTLLPLPRAEQGGYRRWRRRQKEEVAPATGPDGPQVAPWGKTGPPRTQYHFIQVCYLKSLVRSTGLLLGAWKMFVPHLRNFISLWLMWEGTFVVILL